MTAWKPLLCVLALAGCADKIEPTDNPDAGVAPDGELVATGPVTTVENADGSHTTLVDATAMTGWRYLELGTGSESSATGAWDLRFQRFHVSANGGVSGTAGVEVAFLETAFAAVVSAPSTGWVTDAEDSDDPDADPDYAFDQNESWYDYNVTTHVLTPRPRTYVVRSATRTVKLAIETYYDRAGTAAWFRLRWAAL